MTRWRDETLGLKLISIYVGFICLTCLTGIAVGTVMFAHAFIQALLG
jgi:hypothetical protein